MKISDKQLEMISKAAAQVAFEHLERERQQQEKRKHDRRLRNIKLLLKNYRTFVVHTSNIKLEVIELNRKLELDELDTDEFAIRSVMRSKELTLAMVKYINKTLEVYKIICENSRDPEALRRYQIVYEMYISEEKKTLKEIADGQSVHTRTIYKDVDKACETLVVLMFGVNGLKLT